MLENQPPKFAISSKTQITENFQLWESAVSREYSELLHTITVDLAKVGRFEWYCLAFLQPWRKKLGYPIHITSAICSHELSATRIGSLAANLSPAGSGVGSK